MQFILQGKSSSENVEAGGIPKGAMTSDYYRCKEIPDRFNHPGEYKQAVIIVGSIC